jgi:hypothetical protein
VYLDTRIGNSGTGLCDFKDVNNIQHAYEGLGNLYKKRKNEDKYFWNVCSERRVTLKFIIRKLILRGQI